jgi:hypothetical protein
MPLKFGSPCVPGGRRRNFYALLSPKSLLGSDVAPVSYGLGCHCRVFSARRSPPSLLRSEVDSVPYGLGCRRRVFSARMLPQLLLRAAVSAVSYGLDFHRPLCCARMSPSLVRSAVAAVSFAHGCRRGRFSARLLPTSFLRLAGQPSILLEKGPLCRLCRKRPPTSLRITSHRFS